jgi:hypothetical protein
MIFLIRMSTMLKVSRNKKSQISMDLKSFSFLDCVLSFLLKLGD